MNVFERHSAVPAPAVANRALPARPLSKQQLALIHVARQQTGIDDDAYRRMLALAEGVGSSKELTEAGFERLMQLFAVAGFEHRSKIKKAPAYGARRNMASQAQLDIIHCMWARWCGRDDPEALAVWLEKHFHVASTRFVTAKLAQKAIEALKAMLARKRAAEQSNVEEQ